MLPDIMVSEDVAAGRLVRLLPDYTPPVRPLNLLYLRDRRMSPKLRSIRRCCTTKPATRITVWSARSSRACAAAIQMLRCIG